MKVAILGFAETSRDAAPYDDPSWSIWGVNGTWTFARRIDVLLDLHAPWIYAWEQRRRPAGHVAFMQRFAGPVYLIERRDDIPTSTSYPLDDVIRQLGRPYLTSSIALAVALAMVQGATDIGLYGVEMKTSSEYADQRPGLEYLLGRAEERGIRIHLPEGVPILSGPVYGRGDLNPGGERLTPDQFERRLATLQKRVRDLEHQAARQDGALREAEHLMTLGPASDAYRAHVETLQADLAETLETLARVRGMVDEARYWVAQTPEGAAQARFRLPAPVVLPDRPRQGQTVEMPGVGPVMLTNGTEHN